MFGRSGLRRAAWICGLAWTVSSASAQIGRVNGMISGQVSDANGAPVAAAQVSLTGSGGLTRSVTTPADGRFIFFDLPTGTYTVQVAAPAFAPYRHSGVVVAVGREVQLSAVLRPAGSRQTVTVHAQQNLLDTSQTSSVTNIDKDRVEELPIESRNYLAFTLLAPQVAPGNPAIAQQTLAPAESGFSFGGLRPASNAVYIDGVDDNDEYTGASRTELSPEAISDFQIVNHGFAAESGGAAGGSIDVQTREGMPLQHGDAFIFVQNGALIHRWSCCRASRMRAACAQGYRRAERWVKRPFITWRASRSTRAVKMPTIWPRRRLRRSTRRCAAQVRCRRSRCVVASFRQQSRRRSSLRGATGH
jgi:hypothetical protein